MLPDRDEQRPKSYLVVFIWNIAQADLDKQRVSGFIFANAVESRAGERFRAMSTRDAIERQIVVSAHRGPTSLPFRSLTRRHAFPFLPRIQARIPSSELGRTTPRCARRVHAIGAQPRAIGAHLHPLLSRVELNKGGTMPYGKIVATAEKNCITVLVPGFMGSSLQKLPPNAAPRQAWTPVGAELIESALEKRNLWLVLGVFGLLLGALALWSREQLLEVRSLRRTRDGRKEADGVAVRANGVLGAFNHGSSTHIYDGFLRWFDDKAVFTSADQVVPTQRPAFVMFPYDFRLDLAQQADELATFLKTTRNRAGVKRINLVGHSMGALTSFACVARHPELKDVLCRVVLLGGPLNGTPETLTNLLKPNEEHANLNLLADARTLLTTWPSVYQMLPSEYYATKDPHGFARLRDGATSAQIAIPLLATYRFLGGTFLDQEMTDAALDFHRNLDQGFGKWEQPERVSLIVGDQPTNRGFVVRCGEFSLNKIISQVDFSKTWALTMEGMSVSVMERARPGSEADDWVLTNFIGETFQIMHPRTRRKLTAVLSSRDVVLTYETGASTRWKLTVKGAIESADNQLVWELGPIHNNRYPLKLAAAHSTYLPAQHFALDFHTTSVERVDDAQGDGTVTTTGSTQIVGLSQPLSCTVAQGVSHMDLPNDPRSLALIADLLEASDRTLVLPELFQVKQGPVGGTGRLGLVGRNAPDFHSVAPAGGQITAVTLHGNSTNISGGWVSGIDLQFSDGSSSRIGRPVAGDVVAALTLQPDEYLAVVYGSVHEQPMDGRTYQVLRGLELRTNIDRRISIGGSIYKRGEFLIWALPGYRIRGLWGRADDFVHCLGAIYDHAQIGDPSPRQVLTAGPSGHCGGMMFGDFQKAIYEAKRLQSITATVDSASCITSLDLRYVDRATGDWSASIGVGEHRGEQRSLTLEDDEHFVRMTGKIGTVVGFLVGAFPQVTQLVLSTQKGRKLVLGDGRTSEGSETLPFEYGAPDGYHINGLFGRGDTWGTAAIGAWYVPL